MRLLILDNYDSFTYNLSHLAEKILHECPDVVKNDQIVLDEIDQYDAILLSPGPGLPIEAGLLMPLIEKFAPTKKILGICLGHQAIGQAMGASLVNLPAVFHGVAEKMEILDKENPIFKGLESPQITGRYHSWAISTENLPTDLLVTATDAAGVIMGIRHKKYNLQGLQFHPESIMTIHGETMLRNWLFEC